MLAAAWEVDGQAFQKTGLHYVFLSRDLVGHGIFDNRICLTKIKVI